MDTPEKPKRPWWRKKRWRLVIVFWLALPALYVLSVGPAMYVDRCWYGLPLEACYRPVTSSLPHAPLFVIDSWNGYLTWWSRIVPPVRVRPMDYPPTQHRPPTAEAYASWRERFVTKSIPATIGNTEPEQDESESNGPLLLPPATGPTSN